MKGLIAMRKYYYNADGTQAIQKVEKKFIKINVENVNGRNYKPKVQLKQKSKRKDLGNMKNNTLTIKECSKYIDKSESAVRI